MTDWLIHTTVETLVLGATLLCACRMYRFHPATENLLWLVLLIKFIMPPVLHWPAVSWNRPEPVEQASSPRSGVRQTTMSAPAFPAVIDVEGEGPEPATTSPVERETVESAETHYVLNAETVNLCQTVAWTIWLVASGCLFIWQFFRIAAFHRRVTGGTRPENWLSKEVHRQAGRLQVPAPSIRIVGDLSCPLIWCLGRPRLCWPADLRDTTAARGMIIHELAHLRRKDHLVVWLSLVAGFIWWWNPLFWLTRRRLVETADLCCDAWVTRLLPESRRSYAESLIALFERTSDRPRLASASCVVGGPTYRFERRMKMIMQSQMSPSRSYLSTAVVLLLAGLVLPGWSQQSDGSRNEQESAKHDAAQGGDPYAAPQGGGDVEDPFAFLEESTAHEKEDPLGLPQELNTKRAGDLFGDVTAEHANPLTIRVFPLKYVQPVKMMKIALVLARAMSPKGAPELYGGYGEGEAVPQYGEPSRKMAHLVADRHTNSLIVKATRKQLALIAQIVEAFDVTKGQPVKLSAEMGTTRILTLQHREAAEMARLIRSLNLAVAVLLPVESSVGKSGPAHRSRQAGYGGYGSGYGGAYGGGSSDGGYGGYGGGGGYGAEIITTLQGEIDTGNMLILAGDALALDEVERLVKALDKPSQRQSQ